MSVGWRRLVDSGWTRKIGQTKRSRWHTIQSTVTEQSKVHVIEQAFIYVDWSFFGRAPSYGSFHQRHCAQSFLFRTTKRRQPTTAHIDNNTTEYQATRKQEEKKGEEANRTPTYKRTIHGRLDLYSTLNSQFHDSARLQSVDFSQRSLTVAEDDSAQCWRSYLNGCDSWCALQDRVCLFAKSSLSSRLECD